MSLKCGIVGLPNVGKSTLFNALTQTASAQAANYPFCTIEPNIGKVNVPDERLEKLAKVAGSAQIIPAQIEFVDIAGLVRGASKGEGLGNFVWLKRLPDFARYNIGGPQWNNGQRYLNALQAIDNLVDGAIASSHRYDIIGKWINLTGQGFCVAPFKSFADCKSTTRPGKGIEYLMKKPSSFASGCRIENNKNATV